jgi:hypothetical protein
MLYDQTLLLHRAHLAQGDPYARCEAPLRVYRPWQALVARRLLELAQRLEPRTPRHSHP